MHNSEGLEAVWIVWGMVLAGVGLILASLWKTSERFWYWKQARHLATGEVAQASEVLRIGQHFRLLPVDSKESCQPTLLNEEANRVVSELLETAAPTGRIIGMTRDQLLLSLESDTLTRNEEQARQFAPLCIGQSLVAQITGNNELFRFSAIAREVGPDPDHPSDMRVTVDLPFWLARIQRRRHVRTPMRNGVTLQAVNGSASENIPAESLRGTLNDLSGGGLCLELDSPQRPEKLARLCGQWGEGEMLECCLNMPLLSDTPLYLRIHSCERIVVRGGLGLRIRGEFAHIPAWQQETIASLVFQAQRQCFNEQTPRFQAAV